MLKNHEREGVSEYFQLEGTVSNSFNRLKGMLFNLVEATITDKQQCEAVKGIIKGFANGVYESCVNDMRYRATEMKLLEPEEAQNFPPMSANPLDTTF
jgi:hypothetical protein